MVKLINRDFGNEMWVADDRAEEYIRAGHRLASDAPAEEPAETIPKTAVKAVKRQAAKPAAAKKRTTVRTSARSSAVKKTR